MCLCVEKKQKQIIDSEVFADVDFLCVLEFLKFQNIEMYCSAVYILPVVT